MCVYVQRERTWQRLWPTFSLIHICLNMNWFSFRNWWVCHGVIVKLTPTYPSFMIYYFVNPFSNVSHIMLGKHPLITRSDIFTTFHVYLYLFVSKTYWQHVQIGVGWKNTGDEMSTDIFRGNEEKIEICTFQELEIFV